MPKIGSMLPSKYLKKDDLEEHDGELVVTVAKIGQRNIAQEGEAPNLKWLCRFKELEKPMVLNPTVLQLMAKALASDDTDDWIGKKCVLYVDDTVQFAGKIVGGLRVKAARKAAPRPQQQDDGDGFDEPAERTAPARSRTPGADDGMDDDIPFIYNMTYHSGSAASGGKRRSMNGRHLSSVWTGEGPE